MSNRYLFFPSGTPLLTDVVMSIADKGDLSFLALGKSIIVAHGTVFSALLVAVPSSIVLEFERSTGQQECALLLCANAGKIVSNTPIYTPRKASRVWHA